MKDDLLDDEFFLSLEEINEEIRGFYKDIAKFANYGEEERNSFIRIGASIVSVHIAKALQPPKGMVYIFEAHANTAIICLGIEKLLALCAMREEWQTYWAEYQRDSSTITFSPLKRKVLRGLQGQLTSEQHKRIADVLDYVHIQRNNFIHANPKGMIHHAIDESCLVLILVLAYYYRIPLSRDALKHIKAALKNRSAYTGLQLRDVGFHNQRDLFIKEIAALLEGA